MSLRALGTSIAANALLLNENMRAAIAEMEGGGATATTTRDTLHSAIHAAGGTDTCRWPDPCPPPLCQTSMVTLQLDDEAHVTPAPAVGVEDDDTDTDAAGSKGGS